MVSFTVLIITHGREDLLMKCLDSLRPPMKNWKLVLVANGKKLPESIISFASSLAPNFYLLETTQRYGPGKARNLALEYVEGEWIFFIDDDAYIFGNYWEILEPLLEEKHIDVLGGPDSPAKEMRPMAQSLAIALSSPLCTGGTFARHQGLGKRLVVADEEKLTSCNLWVRHKTIGQIRFSENYFRAEENQFLQVLKREGCGMFYHPRLAVAHHRRSRLKDLVRPSFLAGFYRSKLLREKLSAGGEVFWLPSIFVLLHLLLFFLPETFWALTRIYVGVVLAVSIGLCVREKKPWLFPLVAFLHYFVVFLYGLGFLTERLRTALRKSNTISID